MKDATVPNTATKGLLRACERRGINTRPWMNDARLEPRSMERYGDKIPIEHKNELWAAAMRRLGDDRVGLLAAVNVPFGAYGVLDHLLFACPSLGELLPKLSALYELINPAERLHVTRWRSAVVLELSSSDSHSHLKAGLSAEYAFAMLLLRLRSAYGPVLNAEAISLTAVKPVDISLHARTFRCAVNFGSSRNTVNLAASDLTARPSQGDPQLTELLEAHARRQLRHSAAEPDMLSQVRDAIRAGLKNGDVSLKSTARSLAMSERTLQRSLAAGASSYRDELDGVRQRIARELRAEGADVSELVHRLCFTEPSAYYRARRRWFAK